LKKSIFCFLFLTFAVSLLLPACQPSVVPPVSSSSMTEEISSAEPSSLPAEPSVPSSDPGPLPIPLQAGENLFSKASIRSITDEYGPFSSYNVRYEGEGTGCFEIHLFYENMRFVLYTDDIESARSLAEAENQSSGAPDFDFGELPLTEEELTRTESVRAFSWSDPSIEGPRGIRVGDSADQVRASFLDKSSLYTDGTLYSEMDAQLTPPLSEDDLLTVFFGGEVQSDPNLFPQIDQEIEYVLAYYAPVFGEIFPNAPEGPGYYLHEFTRFVIADEKVVWIEQGYWSYLETP